MCWTPALTRYGLMYPARGRANTITPFSAWKMTSLPAGTSQRLRRYADPKIDEPASGMSRAMRAAMPSRSRG